MKKFLYQQVNHWRHIKLQTQMSYKSEKKCTPVTGTTLPGQSLNLVEELDINLAEKLKVVEKH